MFTSNPDTTAKTVDWDAFVTAMVDAGFAARHSSGSAVIFEPDDRKRGWVGKIVFHKPHPIAKIDTCHAEADGEEDGEVVWLEQGDVCFTIVSWAALEEKSLVMIAVFPVSPERPMLNSSLFCFRYPRKKSLEKNIYKFYLLRE